MANDIETAISDNAAGPKRAARQDLTVEQHSLPDLIAADKHLANKAAMAGRGLGIKLCKLVPHGSV